MLWDWRIFYLFQGQGLGGHGFTCLSAATALNDLSELVEGHLATAHLYQRAYHGAHHIAQKAVGGNLEIPRGL